MELPPLQHRLRFVSNDITDKDTFTEWYNTPEEAQNDGFTAKIEELTKNYIDSISKIITEPNYTISTLPISALDESPKSTESDETNETSETITNGS